jgi:PAS domain S-box-containing protein
MAVVNRKVQVAFGAAILILLLMCTISYREMAATSESDQWVLHTHVVLNDIQDLRFSIERTESNCRAFVLTGNDSYLASYRASRATVEQDQATFASLTADNPVQQDQLSTLNALIATKLQHTEQCIRLRQEQGLPAAAAFIQSGTGLRMMNEIQAESDKLQNEELRLLVLRDKAARQHLMMTRIALIAGCLFGVLIAAGAGWSVKRDSSALRLAEGEESRSQGVREESDAKYAGLLEAAPDAMVVVNQAGEIVLLNLQAEKQFGYHRDELLGQRVTNIIPEGFAERILSDETRTTAEALAQQIGTGIELNALRKDGTEFPIEIMLSPLENADGILVTAAIRDITVRRESEAKYTGLMEAAPDAMVVVNQSGEIVLLNLQAEKQFGYRRDELLGQQVTNIIPEGFAERILSDGTRTAAEALAQQIGTGIELNALRKNGTEFPIEIMLSPLDSAEGILITAAIRDITVRRESEAKYAGLLEAAPDAMVVVNQSGEIVLLNLQAEKQFGYHRDELLGQQVTNIIPEGFAERILSDGTRTAAEALEQQIGTGIELNALRKNGTEFPIEIMLSPLENADGILFTAAIRDITVRREAEAKYTGLLEAAPDAMVVVNQSGEIVLLNLQAENQFGYPRDELLGQQVTNIIPEGFAERLTADALRSREDALTQQIGTGIELDGRRKDGSSFPIELMLSPLQNVDGILVTAAIRNITVRRKADANLVQKIEELSRSNQELENFAYIASHDLQEPLRMVASYTQLLARRYKGKLDSDADEFIAFAVDGASRMQRLIQDLLLYSRVGTKGADLVDTSSEEALQQALHNLTATITDSGAIVTHDALPHVCADEIQLVQLFQNLIGNAIKYQKPGTPEIHISVVKDGWKKWMFSIKDNGLGIEPQYFERIFGMFQRLHKREEFAGTGIGLAICKKIVERHGGTIAVESEYGHGSTFHFALTASRKTF